MVLANKNGGTPMSMSREIVPQAEHEGFAVTAEYELGADYEWICAGCFDFAKEAMGWRDVTPPPKSTQSNSTTT